MEARRLRNRNQQTAAPAVGAPAPDPTPISAAKLAANRANAQHSSGPRTEQGKASSSRNNTRHGLAGDFVLLPEESEEEFNHLFDSLLDEHKPKTVTEALLVQGMAQHHWLTQRALRFQNRVVLRVVDEDKLSLYLRYQTTHQRAFHKSLNDLLKLQKQRKSEERGFESQKAKVVLAKPPQEPAQTPTPAAMQAVSAPNSQDFRRWHAAPDPTAPVTDVPEPAA